MATTLRQLMVVLVLALGAATLCDGSLKEHLQNSASSLHQSVTGNPELLDILSLFSVWPSSHKLHPNVRQRSELGATVVDSEGASWPENGQGCEEDLGAFLGPVYHLLNSSWNACRQIKLARGGLDLAKRLANAPIIGAAISRCQKSLGKKLKRVTCPPPMPAFPAWGWERKFT